MILQANSSHLFLWQLTEFVSLLIFYRGPERSWVKLIIFSVFPRQQICFVFTQCHEWITTLSRNNKCCLFWNSDRLFSRPQGNKLSVIFPKQRDNPSRENNLMRFRRTRACAHTHTHTLWEFQSKPCDLFMNFCTFSVSAFDLTGVSRSCQFVPVCGASSGLFPALCFPSSILALPHLPDFPSSPVFYLFNKSSPEFFPSLLPIHTCAASPSSALPSSQC